MKDAPRLWNAALQRVLRKCGLCAVQTDRQLFVKHKNGKLILALSVHVDDIKMTGLDDEIKSVLKTLSEPFDELKLERDNFEHLGHLSPYLPLSLSPYLPLSLQSHLPLPLSPHQKGGKQFHCESPLHV